ncbi:UNVERIFIED_CONTAM: hypothetical protein FKN15_047583 [Acipenser sinensis]
MERIVMQVNFPNPAVDILFVAPQPASRPPQHNLETLDVDAQKQLQTLFSKESTLGFSKADKEFLWDKRHYCQSYENSLPMVLASAPSWDWISLPEIHSLLNQWPPLSPVCALELLHSRYADSEVRSVAVTWIERLSDDELADYLPQLVQALKFECYLNNALVMLLLSRALGSIHIAHYLYWLLKEAVQDLNFGRRYENVLGALLSLCGKGQREELEKQTRLVQLLAIVAKKVRQASGSARQIVLQEGMDKVQSFFLKNNCRLPLNPSLVAKELNIKACSFFNSNAVPLKITLVNADPLGEEINVMFKVGEDLRQDMLALQLIKIMDKLWVQEGLDLRIVNFKCISTGKDRGMVELVPASDTLRKIQVEYGVTGSFKDKPLAEWLRKYNPAEEEYEKASENFIYSCAGCCVATYVLGICDRHNDNIMLRSTGHMFHIDFGKFLGHAQMFGSFKRDRAPFVLTSDMAYVINGGERPTRRFQLFVDLCCQAYNLIRKHTNLFLNLLSLMTSSGLPELTSVQDLKYVYDALQPQTTDSEATIFFTRLIESSLGSVATKFNFFIHNLAQLRFSGLPSNDEPILLFSPKTYSMKQEGRIKDVSVFTYQKRYNPDKHYWLKLTSEDVKEQIYKLAKKGLTPSQIGFQQKGPVPISAALQTQCTDSVILRDSHGVAQVRFVTGNKILRILKSKGLAPDLPEDLYHLIKKAVAVRKHLERSRKDKDAKFRLILVESRIHRLARYYKSKRVLPPNWKYSDSEEVAENQNYCQNCSETETEEDDWDSSSNCSASDQEENNKLWDSFVNPTDPYSPLHFTACTASTSTTQKTSECLNKHTGPVKVPAKKCLTLANSTKDSCYDSQSISDEESNSEDEDSCEKLNKKLWDLFSQSSDPYNLLNFRACLKSCPTDNKSEDNGVRNETNGTGPVKATSVKPNLPKRHFKHYCQNKSKDNQQFLTWKKPAKVAARRTEEKEEKDIVKKVTFSPVVHVHVMHAWDFALRAARKSPWEEMARDRARFQRRIQEAEETVGCCWSPDHREKIQTRLSAEDSVAPTVLT